MHAKHWCLAALLCISFRAVAYPVPPRGTEDIPKLMADSTLVCKGEVIEAPPLKFVQSMAGVPRMTAIAAVPPDRCFKGTPPAPYIQILFDDSLTGVDPAFVLQKGYYRLFFLKPHDGNYAIVDPWFGALTVSRELGPAPDGAHPVFLLELDLNAGLRDSDPERVLDSIRMLGNMKHLRSTLPLKQRLDDPSLLVRTYVWQALLRLKDYSVLPAVSNFFDTQPEPPHELRLPEDRLFEMQFELTTEVAGFRDAATLPYAERFAVTGKSHYLRSNALQALRNIGSPHSPPAFLKELDDPDHNNGFSAMQGLLSLAGGAPGWVPSWEQFLASPDLNAAKCREWWRLGGEASAATRVPSDARR